MTNPLKAEFEYFLAHQDELVKTYNEASIHWGPK